MLVMSKETVYLICLTDALADRFSSRKLRGCTVLCAARNVLRRGTGDLDRGRFDLNQSRFQIFFD